MSPRRLAMETLRAFIAVEPDSRTRGWLGGFLEALCERHPRVRWVRPEHLHLTLKFLGNAAPAVLEEVALACAGPARAVAPLRLTAGLPAAFGPRSAPRTFFLGFAPSPDLEALKGLQAALEAALEPLGFPPEERSFEPHLTLGRNPRAERAAGWQELLPPWPGEGPPRFQVEELRLYSSELCQGGPVHHLLHQEALRGSPRSQEVPS